MDDSVITNKEERYIENKYIKAEINLDGTLNVLDKLNNKLYSNIAAFEDSGDSGDEYNYSYPTKDKVIYSRGCEAEITFEETGQLRTVAKIKILLNLPESLTDDHASRSEKTRVMPVVTWVTIDANSPVIKFKTQVHNTVKDHRFRVLFPTGICTDYSYAETQFDVVKRRITPESFDNSSIPENIKRIIIGARECEPITTFPQRTFVDVTDGKVGAAVLNRGLPEYEVLRENNTIALTLFRGINWITRTDLNTRIGDAGPEISVPDAQCLRYMEFNYAFYPHGGDWETGKVPVYADDFNTDLAIVKTDLHEGQLNDSMEFACLQDSTGSIKVTAVKRAEDGKGIVIRISNLSEYNREAEVRLLPKIRNVFYTNLNEEITHNAEVSSEHNLKMIVPAKKIITLKIEPELQSKLAAKEAKTEILRNDILREEDLSQYQPVQAISPESIEQEEIRAANLDRELNIRKAKLSGMLSKKSNPGCYSENEIARLRLEIETLRRASLEAKVSALLLKRKYIETETPDENKSNKIRDIEEAIRKVGYELNDARVQKRALEYIVDHFSTTE